jgi:hypothetical protein
MSEVLEIFSRFMAPWVRERILLEFAIVVIKSRIEVINEQIVKLQALCADWQILFNFIVIRFAEHVNIIYASLLKFSILTHIIGSKSH